MSALQKLVTPESVILELTETDHEEVVLEMIGHLCKIGKIPSGDCYCMGNAVLERESHVATGVGAGVAIPHARVKGLKETLAVFGRSSDGVDFECPDNVPCRLIFLMLVPEEKAARHLQMLAELARVFQQAGLRKMLEEARTVDEICDVFANATTAA
ncbi:MAG: PTS sugar transporter subunit IIA [Akkermansiaceae bacterium]|jgi:mannitol/fructose-specific phosphotransferase system IIA component (Ntr-type)